MKASEIMERDVVTCQIGDNVNRAAQLMWEHRCGLLPVLDENQRVVGIVTDRDACMAAYTQGRPLLEIPVATAMTGTVHGCDPSASVDEVQEAMRLNRAHRLMVLDAEGRLEGLISLDDIARCAATWNGKSGVDLEKVALTLAEISPRTGPECVEREPEPDNLLEVVRSSLDALKTLRDEIRVDLNLAGKEMRERWNHLEGQVRLAEIRARADGATSLDAVIESVKKFRNSLRRPESGLPR